MNTFTFEEMNLLWIYDNGSRQGAIVGMKAALPFIDGEMRELVARTLEKVEHMTAAEYIGIAICAADEA